MLTDKCKIEFEKWLKSILILLFSISMSAHIFAQSNYQKWMQPKRSLMFSYGVDVMNLTKGSAPTEYKSAHDFTIGVAGKTGHGGLQIGINYQNFKKIGYYDLELEVGYMLHLGNRFIITPQMSSKLIIRHGENVEQEITGNEYIGQKVSLNVKFGITPSLYIGLDWGVTFRGDKYTLLNQNIPKSLVPDGTFEIIYTIPFD